MCEIKNSLPFGIFWFCKYLFGVLREHNIGVLMFHVTCHVFSVDNFILFDETSGNFVPFLFQSNESYNPSIV